MTNLDRPLDPGLAREVAAAILEGHAILGLDRRTATPDEALTAIQEAIDCQRAADPPLDGEEIDDLAVALGCLWGDAVVRDRGWRWGLATIDGAEAFVIVSPEDSRRIPPLHRIRDELRKPPGEPTNLTLNEPS